MKKARARRKARPILERGPALGGRAHGASRLDALVRQLQTGAIGD
jgi:hypothetical protein